MSRAIICIILCIKYEKQIIRKGLLKYIVIDGAKKVSRNKKNIKMPLIIDFALISLLLYLNGDV
jgi:hypothetical protein